MHRRLLIAWGVLASAFAVGQPPAVAGDGATKTHTPIVNAPQASGTVHERNKSYLDGQPMNAKVHEYDDRPQEPGLWQRMADRTRSFFSRTRAVLSPKQPAVSESRFTMVGQPDATQALPGSTAQNKRTWFRQTETVSRAPH